MGIAKGVGTDMSTTEVECVFRESGSALANIWAGQLRDELVADITDVQVRQERSDSRNQDFGATLIIAFGTPAVIALARGLSSWLRRRSEAELTLISTDRFGQTREVKVSGQLGHRAETVIREFLASADGSVNEDGSST
jgi:hypothetical protein